MSSILRILMLWLLLGTVFASEIPARILDIRGRGQHKEEGKRRWMPVIKDTAIHEGHTIRTGPGAYVQVNIQDIGNIYLLDACVIKIKKMRTCDDGKVQIFVRILSGKMRASLDVSFPYPYFLVESGHGRGSVTGTDFLIYANRGDCEFYVIQGKVQINNIFNTAQALVMTDDSYSTVTKESSPEPPQPIPQAIYEEWDIHITKPESGQPSADTPTAIPADKRHEDLITPDSLAAKENPLPPTEEPPADSLETPPADTDTEAAPEEKKEEPEKEKTDKSREKWEFTIAHRMKTGYYRSPDRAYQNKWGNVNHWINLTYMPELRYGPFSAGLYLPIYIGFRSEFYRPKNFYNWDEYNFHAKKADWFRDLLVKFIFFEFRLWRFSFRIGGLDNVTYGSGFILNGFSNMLEFPNTRVNGLKLGYTDEEHGFATSFFWGDLSRILILGWRLDFHFVKMFGKGKETIWNKLGLGFCLVVEDDPVQPEAGTTHQLAALTNSTNDHSITGIGLDLSMPLGSENMSAVPYLNMGFLTFGRGVDAARERTTYGPGFSIGIKGKAAMATYRTELFYNTHGFLPEYFTSYHYYALKRADSLAMLLNLDRGYNLGWLIMIGMELKDTFAVDLTFNEFFLPLTTKPVRYRFLRNSLRLDARLIKGAVEKVYGNAYYQRENLVGKDFFRDFLDENTIIGAEIHFIVYGPLELIFRYQSTFKDDGKPSQSFNFEVALNFPEKKPGQSAPAEEAAAEGE